MKALKKILSTTTLAIILLSVAFHGCNNSSNEEKKANEEVADTISKIISLTPETKILLYQFPTPFEVTQMLIKAKAGFIFDITNSPANVGKYSTENTKALNLGVYSADLSYAATYNRDEEMTKFLGCTNKLAEDLGISGVYDQSMIEKIKKFSNNKDSLVAMVTRIFATTNEFLSKNDRNQVAVLIATGTFVESLYIAAELNVVAKDNTRISAIIFSQKENLDKLLAILDVYKQDKQLTKIVEDVAKLKPIFTDYGLESGKKLPQEKAVLISDLAESVRLTFVQ